MAHQNTTNIKGPITIFIINKFLPVISPSSTIGHCHLPPSSSLWFSIVINNNTAWLNQQSITIPTIVFHHQQFFRHLPPSLNNFPIIVTTPYCQVSCLLLAVVKAWPQA